MRYVLALAIFATLFTIPRASYATDTVVGYSFYGPAGNYKIELFEVGAPYPSRQDIVNGYGGFFTYRRKWSAIVASRYYFIRITNTQTGVAKQTHARYILYNGGYYEWPTCYWDTM